MTVLNHLFKKLMNVIANRMTQTNNHLVILDYVYWPGMESILIWYLSMFGLTQMVPDQPEATTHSTFWHVRRTPSLLSVLKRMTPNVCPTTAWYWQS